MLYNFNENTQSELRKALLLLQPLQEQQMRVELQSRHYIYLKFLNPIEIEVAEEQSDPVAVIFEGDHAFLKCITHHIEDTDILNIDFGLRWRGTFSEGRKIIHATGFALKFSSLKSSISDMMGIIFTVFNENGFIIKNDEMVIRKQLLKIDTTPKASPFQRSPRLAFFEDSEITDANLKRTLDYIRRSIIPIKPKYNRAGEGAMNPAYTVIGDRRAPLKLNEKIIWLLRSDGLLVTGIKNSYWVSFGDQSLANAFREDMLQYINWDDRYGHPSLAISDQDEEQLGIYGGFLSQRNGFLEVFTASGRYCRDELPELQTKILEAYLAYQFQYAFGEQDIVFEDGARSDYFELSIFYSNQRMPPYIPHRLYTREMIGEILMDKVTIESTCFRV